MGALLDIIGSLVVRGTLIAMIVGLTITLNNALYTRTAQSIVKSSIANTSEIFAADIVQAGYNSTSTALVSMEPSAIDFLGDVNNDDTVDFVRYFVDWGEKALYRAQNGESATALLTGIETFELEYLDAQGLETSDPLVVRAIHLTIVVKDAQLSSEGAATGYWEGIFYPPNI